MMHELSLGIQTDQECILLRGSPEECVGTTLSGAVKLHPKGSVKLKSLSIRLEVYGLITGSAALKNGSLKLHDKHKFAHDETVFFETKDAYTLPAKCHHYKFAFPIDGFWPETVHCNNISVKYKLIATAETTSLHPNHTTEKEVLVKRFPLTNLNEPLPPINVSDAWSDILEYDLYAAHKVVGMGEELPLVLNFRPLVTDINIKHVGYKIYEFVDSPILKHGSPNMEEHSVDLTPHGDNSGRANEKMVVLKIPTYPKIHHDCKNEFVNIKHKIEVMINFTQGGSMKSIRLRFPVNVTTEITDNFFEALPQYEPRSCSKSSSCSCIDINDSNATANPPPYGSNTITSA
ncbi:hypothetical protein K493DRAFT_316235 [Basidiobolus meristosporus CBS 931.73]|uniref:Arrestin C-terminal-like domain-containing protein n=1 Tax=Basidiobolus meristosporus CBS 931.73 TaxID=1314790 RepID=A0A1Y1Y653_9FUNG|nr:hypothetical protein K493DRAFT_343306 [Basidiobolus meristosporus CBS 931.73]ORX93064.1 hypothetical protein K493DRAFT_316235 [Basidiobolus meristosporus CBS 931.73]|eukprot:ORX64915.1 hypothetical protein K493DRAFT_343306 [Basidiobolus meristosporus CBS 931.73]